MIPSIIHKCSDQRIADSYCSITTTCKGWGCRLLATPINDIPTTDQEKAKLFIKVYREAKHKGVLECPHYRSSIIDEVLDNISLTASLSDFYQIKQHSINIQNPTNK